MGTFGLCMVLSMVLNFPCFWEIVILNAVFLLFRILFIKFLVIFLRDVTSRIPYSDKVRLYFVISSACTGTHWNFLAFVVNLCYFSSLMVNEDEDVPNWNLDDTYVLSQRAVKKFYSSSMKHVD